MILRPVRPVSACGPPSSKMPVGLTKMRRPSRVEVRRQQRVDHVLDQVRAAAAPRGRSRRHAGSRSTRCRCARGARPRRRPRPASCRRAAGTARRRRGAPGPGARRAGGPARSGAASGPASRRRRSRTSSPGRPAPCALRTSSPPLPLRSSNAASTPWRDVRRLRVERDQHATRLPVEAVGVVVVADVADRVAHERWDVDVGRGGHLAGDHHEAGGQQRLAGDTARRGRPRAWRRGRRPRSGPPSCRGVPR